VKQVYEQLFAFHAWARARVLEAADRVPYEGLRRPVLIPGGNGDGSLHATLTHIAAAQAHWLARFQGDAEHRPADGYPDLAAIARAWEQADAGLMEVIAAHDLLEEVRYYRASTQGYDQYPLWRLLLHVSNHTTHHRAEACAALTALGSPPQSVDLVDFLRREEQSP
jgi:uncharacterized damage-inducible protein DinB